MDNKRMSYIINRLADDKKVSVTLAEMNEIIRKGYTVKVIDLYQSERLSIYKIRF